MTKPATSASPAGPSAKVEVYGIQSVMPLRPTDPTITRKVTLTHPRNISTFRKCHHFLLYYKRASEEDSGWVFGGRLRESVGRALLGYPMVAGRLRWGDQTKRELELVSNDSGVRLVETESSMSLDEFLATKKREDVQGELVFWEDVNEDDPHFSPLAYVQVTNFRYGAYSVGFSFSLVLGDLFELSSFIKLSANLQKEMFQESQKPPLFYLPKLKTNTFPPQPNRVRSPINAVRTLVYTVRLGDLEDSSVTKHVAFSCLQDAEERLKVKVGMDLEFSMFLKDYSTGEVSVEVGSKGRLVSENVSSSPDLRCSEWGVADLEETTFWGAHKPESVGYWIGFWENEGLVMLKRPKIEGNSRVIDVIVTIPQ